MVAPVPTPVAVTVTVAVAVEVAVVVLLQYARQVPPVHSFVMTHTFTDSCCRPHLHSPAPPLAPTAIVLAGVIAVTIMIKILPPSAVEGE